MSAFLRVASFGSNRKLFDLLLSFGYLSASVHIDSLRDHHLLIFLGLLHSELRPTPPLIDFLIMRDLISYILNRLNHHEMVRYP